MSRPNDGSDNRAIGADDHDDDVSGSIAIDGPVEVSGSIAIDGPVGVSVSDVMRRDLLACAALQVVHAGSPAQLATLAYELADAMVAAAKATRPHTELAYCSTCGFQLVELRGHNGYDTRRGCPNCKRTR
jgi:hypothetical protein